MKKLYARLSLILVFIAITSVFLSITYIVYKIQQPEYILEKELSNNRANNKKSSDKINKINNLCENTTQAFFSPDDNIKDKLIQFIDNEKKSIKIAIYTLTDKDIAHALIKAQDNNIDVQIVTDRSYGSERYSRIPMLANHKLSIWVYQVPQEKYSLMHNKFVIFEQNVKNKSFVWTGSFNFTKSANEVNQENVIVTDNLHIISLYKKQFYRLKERSLLISGTEKTPRTLYKQQQVKTPESLYNKISNMLKTILDLVNIIFKKPRKKSKLHYYNFSSPNGPLTQVDDYAIEDLEKNQVKI